MNLVVSVPNLVTASRLIGVPVWIYLFRTSDPWLSSITLALLWLTDFFDGWSARRLNQQTHFGSIFDPITDRAATIIMYAWLGLTGRDYLWLSFIVVVRHFSQILSLPILVWWLKKTFYVRARAFPRWVTFANSAYVLFPLYLVDSAPRWLIMTFAVLMACGELWILITYWPRLIAIARGQHNSFE